MIATITALVFTPLYIVLDEFWLDLTGWLPAVPPAISNGLLPTAVLTAGLVLFYMIMKKRFSASKDEAIQASFVLLTVAFVILTMTGVWFRGPGMALAWP